MSPHQAHTRPQPPSTFDRICDDPRLITPCDHKAPYVPRIATQDTTLTVNTADGRKTTFPVLSGTQIRLHIPGLHYNRMLDDILSPRQVLMKSRSAILEGAPQVYAREVSR